MKNRIAMLGLAAVAAGLFIVPLLYAQNPSLTAGGSAAISDLAVDERYVYVLSGNTILRIDKRSGANAGTLSVGLGAGWNATGTLPGTGTTGSATTGSTTTTGTTTTGTTTGTTATGTTATSGTTTGTTTASR